MVEEFLVSKETADTRRFPFFYGWMIVGVFFVNLAVAFGMWYSFSVFFVAIMSEFGWSRAASAGVFSAFIMTQYSAAFIFGSMLDSFGPRKIIPLVSMLMVFGLFASSRIESLWEFYLFYGVLTALGACSIGIIPCGISLSKWFVRRRGLAMGLTTSGIGAGMLLIVPMVQQVISRYGWRSAYCILGTIVLFVVIPLNALLQRTTPEELGSFPDGSLIPRGTKYSSIEKTEPIVELGPFSASWSLREALATRHFWLMFLSLFFITMAVQSTLIHQVAHITDKGFSAEKGAFLFGLIGLLGSGGRIIFGYFSDKVGREKALSVGVGCMGVGILSLMMLDEGRGGLLFAYALPFGLGYGSVAPIFPARAADLFEGSQFGKIYGLLCFGPGIGGAMGTWVVGKVFDLTASYRAGFLMILSALLLALIFFWFASAPGLKGYGARGKHRSVISG
jgi:MFS family permease